jgi:competence protein ComEC
MPFHKKIFSAIFFLVAIDAFVWFSIFSDSPKDKSAEAYFLSVGQGDSELLTLPEGVKILIDGGPDNKVLGELDSILPVFSRYADILIMSHPEADHFSGLMGVVERYEIGAFIWSGKGGQGGAFGDLTRELEKKKIKNIAVAEGDKIKIGESVLEVLSPGNGVLAGKSANESSLVLKFYYGGAEALFTGDIGFYAEKEVLKKHILAGIDVLKVAHHGSKNSSGEEFLAAVSPKIAVIEVGKNGYGHPTKEVLSRLASAGAQVFRTDKNGAVKIIFSGGGIKVLKEN